MPFLFWSEIISSLVAVIACNCPEGIKLNWMRLSSSSVSRTLSGETLSAEILVGQNYSSGEILVTKRKNRHFRQTKKFVTLSYFMRTQYNLYISAPSKNYSSGEIIRRAKFSSPGEKFVTLAQQSFAR